MFSDSAGINVLIDGSADKTISARLVNIKPDHAVKAVFESNGFQVSLQDGIYYISNQFAGDKSGGQSAQLKRLSITVKDLKVTLEVDNAALDQVIRTVSIQSGINIVISKLTVIMQNYRMLTLIAIRFCFEHQIHLLERKRDLFHRLP
jgi:type II secretory pathway component GspD/PulD (secretin)